MTSQVQPSMPSPKPLGPGDAHFDALMFEYEYFQRMKEEWCKRPDLRSKYVSIYKHELIDSGVDQFELGRRAAMQHPGEVVLIVKVEPELPRYEFPSFEIQ